MRIVFMGTPDFAVGALKSLHEAGHEIVQVVTQPDKPKGRGKTMSCSAVKEAALELNLPVFQPKRVKEAEAAAFLKEQNADVFVVAAFGQILTKEVLDIPKYGCINIHASLLPKYRGSAPIQWAILDGEKETGITIMQMDEGIDTGDILFQEVVEITDQDTADSLFAKMAETGSSLIVDALAKIEAGDFKKTPQGESTTAYAKMLKKEMGQIDWNKSTREIDLLVRGMNSWPSAYSIFAGKKIKIWEVTMTSEKANGSAGTVSKVTKNAFFVNTGDGQLQIDTVQLEGKKRMPVQSFLLGNKVEIGDLLG